MTKKRTESRFDKIKPYIKVGATFLTELFTEGLCTSVLSHVGGNKLAKFGARLGAGLLGLKWGSDITDFMCDEVDYLLDDLEDVKDAIEDTKEEENESGT